MLPIGPLMIEHRLIERIIKLWRKEQDIIVSSRKPNLCFIDSAIDFMRTYADRCHHGKEEDILFCALRQKPLPEQLKKILDELLEEHKIARKTVAALAAAKDKYAAGSLDALGSIVESITAITTLYPSHIQKEDKQFFIPVMDYFTGQEKDKMLEDFRLFDQSLIHEKYKSMVAAMEKS
jgi:hemerythrin-like domain-containing protein